MNATGVAVVGYASADVTCSIREFKGIDATSILDRPILAENPGIGGIAHIARAVAATGTPVRAVSWVGTDAPGRRWSQALIDAGVVPDGVVVSGDRTPGATLIEVRTGGTICLFDPGDCHLERLTTTQNAVISESAWVLLTVAPRSVTESLLDALSPVATLVWAVKHDEDAYSPELVERLLRRADIVSFSQGEREYLSAGMDLQERVNPGTLVIETRGSRGVAWSVAGSSEMAGELSVERLEVEDSTGAGDTFIGAFVGHAAHAPRFRDNDEGIRRVVSLATTAAGAMLRRRSTSGRSTGAPQKEIH